MLVSIQNFEFEWLLCIAFTLHSVQFVKKDNLHDDKFYHIALIYYG